MADWVTLPRGWVLNFDMVVIAEALRWNTAAGGDAIPSLTLIRPRRRVTDGVRRDGHPRHVHAPGR